MDEPILHSLTRATFDSATNIASSMYQTAMWSPVHPFSVKTEDPVKKMAFNLVLSVAQGATTKSGRKRDRNEKRQKGKFNMRLCTDCVAKDPIRSRAALLCAWPFAKVDFHAPPPISHSHLLGYWRFPSKRTRDQRPMAKVPFFSG